MLDATTAVDGMAAGMQDGSSANSSARMPCCGNGPARWCVAHTEPQAERWAEANLRQLGYRTYLPMLAVQRRDHAIRSLMHTVLVPLFGRYLFVVNDNAELWRPIREAPGVQSVVTVAGRVGYARAGAVEALQADEEARRCLRPRRAIPAAGDAFRVRHGAAQGHRCVVLSVRRDQARVAMLFLGQLRDVWLPLDALSPVAVE